MLKLQFSVDHQSSQADPLMNKEASSIEQKFSLLTSKQSGQSIPAPKSHLSYHDRVSNEYLRHANFSLVPTFHLNYLIVTHSIRVYTYYLLRKITYLDTFCAMHVSIFVWFSQVIGLHLNFIWNSHVLHAN